MFQLPSIGQNDAISSQDDMSPKNWFESIAIAYQALDREVQAKNLRGVLEILSEDILYWYEHLKGTWLTFIEDEEGRAKHMFNRERGSPFLPGEYVRPFVGEEIAFDLLEFHHNASFASAFQARFNRFHLEIGNFIEPLCAYAAKPKELRPLESIFELDQMRKDIGTSARELARYVALIAEQFEVPKQRTVE